MLLKENLKKITPLYKSYRFYRDIRSKLIDGNTRPYKDKYNSSPLFLAWETFGYKMAAKGKPITKNHKNIVQYHNIYKGKRAFLIGNGPSLNKLDLTKLKDEITIGVNSIYLNEEKMGFLPTHYVVEDNYVAEDRADEINTLRGPQKWFGNYLKYCLKGAPDDSVNWLNVRMRYDNYPNFPYFSENAARQVWTGGSVTYICMQLAFYFGVKELYLIGFDHHYDIPDDAKIDGMEIMSQSDDPNHFDPNYFGKGYRWHDPMVERMEQGYAKAGKFFEKYGQKIYNATAGGKLEVLERVDYNSLFDKNVKK